MKNNIFIFTVFLFSNILFGQIGIDTSDPKATLDIKASAEDLTKTDGIIIPRIDGNQLFLKNNLYGTNQTATLIYVTKPAIGASLSGDTIDVTEVGFYIHNGTKWVKLNTASTNNTWQLSGNFVMPIDFIGTINDQPINFKIDNQKAGQITKDNLSYGYLALSENATGTGNNAYGSVALKSNTTGNVNNAFGGNALYSNTTGSGNNAFGYSALSDNLNGNFNNAFGGNALRSNTSGQENQAFGSQALQYNTTGSYNNAFGSNALTNNTTASYNSAFGYISLEQNITGSYNSAFGSLSLQKNTTGNHNSAFGRNALGINIYGHYNSAFGSNALALNESALRNNAFGYEALIYNKGNDNVAFGYQTLYSNTTGINNSALGNLALIYNTTGSYNTAIGYLAGMPFGKNNLTNTTAIGSYALVTTNNSLILGATNSPYEVNVGINTTEPKAKIHIIKNANQLTPAIIEGCNVYANNTEAAAAGLPNGALYRTATGILMIRY